MGKGSKNTGFRKPKVKTKKDTKKPTAKKTKKSTKKLHFTDLEYKYRGKGKWVIYQLTEDTILSEDFEFILSEIREVFPEDVEYFIPIYTEKIRDKRVSLVLCEGYIFIKVPIDKEDSIFKNRTEHIVGPLVVNKRYHHIGNKDINEFKSNLQRMIKKRIPKKGQKVTPLVGTFHSMHGTVLKIDKKEMIAHVLFKKHSRIVEAPISIVNLEIVD